MLARRFSENEERIFDLNLPCLIFVVFHFVFIAFLVSIFPSFVPFFVAFFVVFLFLLLLSLFQCLVVVVFLFGVCEHNDEQSHVCDEDHRKLNPVFCILLEAQRQEVNVRLNLVQALVRVDYCCVHSQHYILCRIQN